MLNNYAFGVFPPAERPGISVSTEDGITLSASGRARWQNGTSGASTQSVVGAATGFKSLDLPGFAHHVLALRAAGFLFAQKGKSIKSVVTFDTSRMEQ